jgi:hypothetical protein
MIELSILIEKYVNLIKLTFSLSLVSLFAEIAQPGWSIISTAVLGTNIERRYEVQDTLASKMLSLNN